MAADDRAPGEVLAQGVTGHGDRAVDAVGRVEKEFGHQSHVGLFLSDTTFRSRSNRVGSIDARYIGPHNWIANGQATTSQTDLSPTGYLAGPGYIAGIKKSDNHNYFQSVYTDRSPGLNATLGYIARTDIRRWDTLSSYQWKPASQTFFAYGPGMDVTVIYDHEHNLQNWSVSPIISLTLKRLTQISFQRTEAYELYHGIGFRERSTIATLMTSWYKWIDLNLSYTQGRAPNYYPAVDVPSFLGNANNASATVTLRPSSHLRLDEIYYYTRLSTIAEQLPSAALPNGVIFTNHLIRSKINYQFNRDYSFRAILDFNSLLLNSTLVSSAYSKQADTTLLFTYLPHPGTAFYLGYADTFQNIDYDAAATPAYSATTLPGTSTDRQIFVKFSYLLRF